MPIDSIGLGVSLPEETEKEEKFVATHLKWHTPLCLTCKWRDDVPAPRHCLAYPTGIPVSIMMGDVEHTEPYKGDHGLQYEAGDPYVRTME